MADVKIRLALSSQEDAAFILAAFDSALPFLASIGSEAQWGSVPFSAKPDVVVSMTKDVQRSGDVSAQHQGGRLPLPAGWTRIFISLSASGTRTGALCLIAEPPSYVASLLPEGHQSLFMKFLITDRRTGVEAQGAGAALIARAMQEARDCGADSLYSDCWEGNGGRLVRFYEQQGFTAGAAFRVDGKHGPGLPWQGRVLCKQVR